MRAERDTPREVRKLYPAEDCRAVHEVIPPACQACGASLSGQDPHPHRYQVIDLPPVTPDVVEYRLHELRCPCCDTVTRAPLPLGVSRLLTGVTSSKAQHRNVWDFLRQTCAAPRLNRPTPSLLPQAESEPDAPLPRHHEPLS